MNKPKDNATEYRAKLSVDEINKDSSMLSIDHTHCTKSLLTAIGNKVAVRDEIFLSLGSSFSV